MHRPTLKAVCAYTALFRSKTVTQFCRKLAAEPLFRSKTVTQFCRKLAAEPLLDRKSGSAGMPRPISYAVFCLKKKIKSVIQVSNYPNHNDSVTRFDTNPIH